MSIKKGIIFDMDGTLWDSADGVAKSWTEVVQKEYKEDMVITEAMVQSVMGKTMDVIADVLFQDLSREEKDSLLQKCCDNENAYLEVHGGVLYPELEATLQQLKENYHLYIVSNCQSGYIEAFLNHYGFGHYFDDIECYGNNKKSKGDNIALVVERNQIERPVYVGDIQGDYDASCQAGVPFIYAGYGFGTIDAAVPEIESFAQLPEVVKTVLDSDI